MQHQTPLIVQHTQQQFDLTKPRSCDYYQNISNAAICLQLDRRYEAKKLLTTDLERQLASFCARYTSSDLDFIRELSKILNEQQKQEQDVKSVVRVVTQQLLRCFWYCHPYDIVQCITPLMYNGRIYQHPESCIDIILMLRRADEGNIKAERLAEFKKLFAYFADNLEFIKSVDILSAVTQICAETPCYDESNRKTFLRCVLELYKKYNIVPSCQGLIHTVRLFRDDKTPEADELLNAATSLNWPLVEMGIEQGHDLLEEACRRCERYSSHEPSAELVRKIMSHPNFSRHACQTLFVSVDVLCENQKWNLAAELISTIVFDQYQWKSKDWEFYENKLFYGVSFASEFNKGVPVVMAALKHAGIPWTETEKSRKCLVHMFRRAIEVYCLDDAIPKAIEQSDLEHKQVFLQLIKEAEDTAEY